MTWLDDMTLRDLDETVLIEATCIRCLHIWLQSPTALLLKVMHRDVRMAEVAQNLSCPRCRHVGVRLTLIQCHDSSSFVGGMP